jgi:hypothetical protein
MKLILVSLALITTLGSAATLSDPARGATADRSSAQEETRGGPENARLQRLAGTWDAVLFFPDGRGGEQRSTGTLTTAKHADFHTVDSFQGTVMGMPFVGHGINGYCNAGRQYFTFWTDSLSASPLTLHGDYDAAKRELTMHGECLGASGTIEKCRTVARYPDDDHIVWAFYGAGPDGRELLRLRIEYTRQR